MWLEGGHANKSKGPYGTTKGHMALWHIGKVKSLLVDRWASVPRITHFTRSRAFQSIESQSESRILHGFDHFEALKHAANHVFY